MLKIEVIDREVLAVLAQLQRRAADLSPAMRNIAQVLESEAEGNFQNQRGPGGGWPALKPATVRERKRQGYGGTSPILQRSGALARSIESAHGRTFAEVGTNQKTPGGGFSLGAIHQFGAPKRSILPRPFLPITATGQLQPGTQATILEIVRGYLAGS